MYLRKKDRKIFKEMIDEHINSINKIKANKEQTLVEIREGKPHLNKVRDNILMRQVIKLCDDELKQLYELKERYCE
jgi:hypothetical protein